jgi:hypothetical protein
MSDLSLLSGEKRKFDFVAGKTAFDPERTSGGSPRAKSYSSKNGWRFHSRFPLAMIPKQFRRGASCLGGGCVWLFRVDGLVSGDPLSAN